MLFRSASDDQLWFPAGRIRYCLRYGVSGFRMRDVQYAGFYSKAVGGTASGGLSPVVDGEGRVCVVVFSDCGTDVHADDGDFPGEGL